MMMLMVMLMLMLMLMLMVMVMVMVLSIDVDLSTMACCKVQKSRTSAFTSSFVSLAQQRIAAARRPNAAVCHSIKKSK